MVYNFLYTCTMLIIPEVYCNVSLIIIVIVKVHDKTRNYSWQKGPCRQ